MTTEPDLDDVAFLSGKKKYSSNENIFEIGGESSGGRQTRNGVAVCSQKRALCVTGVVIGSLLLTALIIAFAGPSNDCSCAGKMPPGYTGEGENGSQIFNPIATNGEPFPWLEPNLPIFIKPIKYSVTIHPNLTTLDVKGQVTIEILVEKDTSFLVINIQDLNVTERALVTTKGYSIKIIKILEFPPRQQLYIEFKEKLKKKSNYTLNLRWYSKLNPEPEGFYVDEYLSSNGLQRLLAATVLKPNGARRAFPCFDESHVRAPFKISIFRDRFHIGLSNSIVHGTDDVGFYMGTGLLRDDFIETPPVPADAVAWVVSDFQRESLQASSTYQVTTTIIPPLFGRSSNSKSSLGDNFTFKLQKPVKNITALTHSLNMFAFITTTTTTTPAPSTDNQTISGKNLTSMSQSIGGRTIIRKAPSYTFYAPNDLLIRSSFILHLSRDVLEYLQQWLEVAYPLTKVDFVALPSLDRDLISSLGLVTLKASFLTSPQSITTAEHHSAAVKISEAIAKQFFGGITSPKHLKDNWLWDGIVKYLGILTLAPLKEDWPMKEKHLLRIATKALDIDAIHGWKSIVNGTSWDGINEDFYIDKTAAVIAMLHAAIGDNSFRQCFGNFLKTNRYKTAEPLDLWTLCTKKGNGAKNIKEMMNLWTLQPGFPLLTVVKVGGDVSISQKPFQPAELTAIHDDNYDGNNYTATTTSTTTTTTTSSPAPKNKTGKPIKWIFPVSYITDMANTSGTIWLQSVDFTLKVPEGVKWIKMNAHQNGYYRVLYNEDNWSNLIMVLLNEHETLSAKDRMGLISDAFTLCHANLMPCEITMNLVMYLPKEKSWGPMTTALRHLERWRRILKYSECFLMLSEFIKLTLNKPILELKWEDLGTDEIKLLRPEVLLASVLWEDSDSITTAKEILDRHINNESQIIPPNLREVVYTGAVLSGEFLYWQHCWNKFLSLRGSTDGFVERMQLLRALGKTKDAWLQNRLLSHVTLLPTVEVVQVLEAIAGTPTGGAMACRFLQAKWYDLQSKLGQGTINFAKVISAITQYGATKFDYDELKSLVHRFGHGPGMEILNMTLSSVGANVEWVARAQMSLYNWVLKNGHIH
ncbi:endoplasmic reticulum aminopeptidase 2 isoform X2 [Condylostylus longicornis]|uniref:endoplasmic reticulum aminopeptidase 2 isoform X2 n=1 Tax=Condylostylus longicornis TaxID=2530218 RepID=UPI00244DF013|nr:endoplasmic reticulum aminopeptidase 2 isoform X2 [Condylostylus longicornis]